MTENVIQELSALNAELLAKLHEAKKEYQMQGQQIFKKIFVALFEKHKNVRYVQWRQYTPYFNDGEACEFGVHEKNVYVDEFFDDKCRLKPEIEENAYELLWDLKYMNDKEKSEFVEDFGAFYDKYEEICEDFSVLNGIPEEIYNELFGDHVIVTCYNDENGIRFETDECEHD